MKPSRGRCLVRRVETTEQFAGGKIVLPLAVREKIAAQQVEILAVGEPAQCEHPDECDRNLTHMGVAAPDWPMDRVWERLTGTGDPAVTEIPCEWFHPFSGKAGDWALIAPRSLTECGDESGQTFLVNQDDVLAILSP